MKKQIPHKFNYFSLLSSALMILAWTPLLHAELKLEACAMGEEMAEIKSDAIQSTAGSVSADKGELETISRKLQELASQVNSLIQTEFLKPSPDGTTNSIALIDSTLGSLSTAVDSTSLSNPMDSLQSKLLLLIKSGIGEVQSKISFTGRLVFLPKGMCAEIKDLQTNRNILEKNPPKDKKNPSVTDPINFRRHAALAPDKDKFNFIGFSINLDYTKVASDFTTKPSFELKVSGGILITMPENFTYKLETPLSSSDWYVPNVIIKDVFFEKKTGDAQQRHFVLLNFKNLIINEEGMHVSKTVSNSSNSPQSKTDTLKFDLYFTDEVNAEYFYSSRDILFKADLSRPVRSLISQVITEQCDKMMNTKPETRTLWEKISAYRCNDAARIDIAVNHLILEMSPIRIIKNIDDTAPISTFFPKIRAPIRALGEDGGIRVMVRMYSLTGPDATHREELLGAYLNETKLVTNSIDTVYNQLFGLIAANLSYIDNVQKSIKEIFCTSGEPKTTVLTSDAISSINTPSFRCNTDKINEAQPFRLAD